jgi:hypothetical protein
MVVVRRVIVHRRRNEAPRAVGPASPERPVRRAPRKAARIALVNDASTGRLPAAAHRRLRARFTALVAGMIALLLLFAGEIGAPGVIELGFAAVLLGCGMAASGWWNWLGQPPELGPASTPRLDADEELRRHVRLLERRRQRCLDTLSDVQRCAAAEHTVGRSAERLEAASHALAAAVATFDAGIVREEAACLALRVTRWLDRLPSLVEGLERLDLSACRQRLDRLSAAERDGEDLATGLQVHPCAAEETARRSLQLLAAGSKELARVRVDLLTRSAALLARPEPAPAPQLSAAVEAALERGRDWLCRNEARRELRLWAEEAGTTAASAADPVTLVLPRGRDLGMLPFSLVLLGFTTLHASLAVGDIAMTAPMMLLPMAAFYALFLVPGVMLFRESVRSRRREELTICGSSVMLRWRWWMWNGVETVVALPEEHVRRDEVGRSGEHPIHRLTLEGIDGRRLQFGYGLSDVQHSLIVRQMGREAAPMLPAVPAGGLTARPEPQHDP